MVFRKVRDEENLNQRRRVLGERVELAYDEAAINGIIDSCGEDVNVLYHNDCAVSPDLAKAFREKT